MNLHQLRGHGIRTYKKRGEIHDLIIITTITISVPQVDSQP